MKTKARADNGMEVWIEYRRRRTLAWAIPVALCGVAFAVSFVSRNDQKLMVAFFLPLLAFVVLYERFVLWPCPRCGKPFTMPKRDLTFEKKCCNCGLDLWKAPGDVGRYREKQARVDALMAEYTEKMRLANRQRLWRMFSRRQTKTPR